MRRRRGGIVIPSLAAGALLALSLPPWGFWPLAFLGAALLFWRLDGLVLRSRLLAGWLTGVGCFGIGLAWAKSFNWYGAVVLVALEALTMALAAACTPRRAGRPGAFVGAFTLLEAVRMAWPFGGLPIGGVYLGQAGGPLLGAARLGGPLLLTALVWAIGAVVGSIGPPALRAGWRVARRAGRGAPAPPVAVPGAHRPALLACLASRWPCWRSRSAPPSPPTAAPPGARSRSPRCRAAGGAGTSETEVAPPVVLGAQLAASEGLGPNDRLSLVVWPEDVIALPGPLRGTPQAAALAALARRLHATVLAGVTETVSDTSFRNEIVAWGPNGRVVSTFEKVHRVPFGEYVPFRGFFSRLASLSAVPLDAIAGHGDGLMSTPAAPVGVLVSYEVFFAARGRSSVRAGAEVLAVPTNTSSYSTSQVPAQEIAAARVQAVEEGRDLVQAAPTGFSVVIDHRGTILRRSGLGGRAVILAKVGLRRGATLYERFGDLPVEIAAGLLWLSAGWNGRRRPRATGGAPVA